MHQTVGNIMRTVLRMYPLNNEQEAADIVDEALATAQRALRTTVSSCTPGTSPGGLAF